MRINHHLYWLSPLVFLMFVVLYTIFQYIQNSAPMPIYTLIALFIPTGVIFYILWFVRDTRHAVLAAIFFITISPNLPWPIGRFILEIRILFAFLGLMYGIFLNRNRIHDSSNFYLKMILGFFFLLIAYFFISKVPEYGIEKVISFLILIVIPTTIFYIISPIQENDLKLLINIALIISVYYSLRTILFGSYNDPRGVSEFLTNPIGFARYAGLGMVILFSLLIRKHLSIIKISLIYFLLLLFAFALFITGSRGPIISVLFAVMVILFINLRRKEFSLISTIKIIIIFIVLLNLSIYIVPIQLSETQGFLRILSFTETGNDIDTLSSGRSYLLGIAFKGFLDSNYMGIGTGGYASLQPFELYPHNLFIEILIEQGLIGFLIISIVFLFTLHRISLLINGHDFTKAQEVVIVIWFYALMNSMFSADINGNYLFWITGAFVWLLPFKKDFHLSS